MHIRKCINKVLTVIFVVGIAAGCMCMGCGRTQENIEEKTLLHIAFNEKEGTEIVDKSGKVPTADLNYMYEHAVYMENRDPQWRDNGIEGASLLFDGCSTYIDYSPSDVCIGGDSFAISVWVAPRTFEWDDPNAAQNGTEHLTGIVSQCNKEKKQGILLGYQRYGKLCFQVGTGDSWMTLWGGGENLQKYAWNHVVASFDGQNGKISLYLNGILIGEKDIAIGTAIRPAEKEKLYIGKNSHAEQIAAGTYNMFSGLMDEVKLYACALTEEDICMEEVPEIEFEDIWMENILTEDVYKTQYHGGPYQYWMNEPHAPLYYNGMYHLFYQNNMTGTYWRNICWGHLVSEDMVCWKPIKEAITPTENSVVPDGVWSGGATTDKNGVPVLFFTAGNDSFAKDGLISNQNIGAAYPADLSDAYLTDWVILDELAVQQEIGNGRTGEFRDPHIWKEGDIWCMLICTGKFTPDECFQNEPALLDYGSNVFTGPSAFIDPVSGEAYMFCIMQDQRNGAEEGAAGWAHCVGLTRRIWLNDEGTDVKMSPIEGLENLTEEPLIDAENVTIEMANSELENVQEDMLYIKAIIDSKDAKEFGIQVKTGRIRDKTVYTYDKASKTISGYTSNTGSIAPVNSVSGALELEDNKLQMEIYIDRSLVEAFFNDTKSITIRSYSDYTSQGIQFFADEEILLERLYVAPVESIY